MSDPQSDEGRLEAGQREEYAGVTPDRLAGAWRRLFCGLKDDVRVVYQVATKLAGEWRGTMQRQAGRDVEDLVQEAVRRVVAAAQGKGESWPHPEADARVAAAAYSYVGRTLKALAITWWRSDAQGRGVIDARELEEIVCREEDVNAARPAEPGDAEDVDKQTERLRCSLKRLAAPQAGDPHHPGALDELEGPEERVVSDCVALLRPLLAGDFHWQRRLDLLRLRVRTVLTPASERRALLHAWLGVDPSDPAASKRRNTVDQGMHRLASYLRRGLDKAAVEPGKRRLLENLLSALFPQKTARGDDRAGGTRG